MNGAVIHTVSTIIGIAVAVASCDLGAQGLRDYRCRIERVANAEVAPNSTQEFQQKAVGKEFTVERRTGLMVGPLKNSFVTKPQVIDYGSDQNSFKVVTTMKAQEGAGYGSSTHVLIVKEFIKGPAKPFMFADNDEVYFGTCVHF
jgi:hypothetical protein